MKRYAVVADNASIALSGSFDQVVNLRCKDGTDPNAPLHCDEVVDAIGRPLRAEEEDWLALLQVIYAADLVCRRGRNEDWNRHITLYVPLRNPDHLSPHVPLIQEIFGRMTHDALVIHLERDRMPSPGRYPTRTNVRDIDAVALLSGGIDSTAAAINVLAQHNQPCFVACTSSSHVIHAQRAVTSALSTHFGHDVATTGFRVELKRNHEIAPLPASELSQRGRTLLFAGVAAMIAVARGIPEVILGENGIMAINCPLTTGRSGASRRTQRTQMYSR